MDVRCVQFESDLFWQEDQNRQDLAELLALACRGSPMISPEQLAERTQKLFPGLGPPSAGLIRGLIPAAKAGIRRSKSGGARDPRHSNMLVIALAGLSNGATWLRQRFAVSSSDQLFARFQAQAEIALRANSVERETWVSFLSWQFQIPEGNFKDVPESYFGTNREQKEARFECYRKAADNNKVAKSFTVVQSVDPFLRHCRFLNFYGDSAGNVRRCEGFAIPMKDAIYLFGRDTQSNMLKVMVFSRAANSGNRNVYRGLVMTNEPDQATILVAPIVMCRSAAKSHAEAGVGTKTAAEAKAKLGRDWDFLSIPATIPSK